MDNNHETVCFVILIAYNIYNHEYYGAKNKSQSIRDSAKRFVVPDGVGPQIPLIEPCWFCRLCNRPSRRSTDALNTGARGRVGVKKYSSFLRKSLHGKVLVLEKESQVGNRGFFGTKKDTVYNDTSDTYETPCSLAGARSVWWT